MGVLVKHRTSVTHISKGDGEILFAAPDGIDHVEEVVIDGRRLDRGLGVTVEDKGASQSVRLAVVPKAGDSIQIVGIVWQKPGGQA